MKNLETYISRLLRVRRSNGAAPHKPLLLLVLIDLIEADAIVENAIPINEELYHLFQTYWKQLVPLKSEGSVFKPLYHLKNDGLWRLIGHQQQFIDKEIGSARRMKKEVAYGQLDAGLFELLQEQEARDFIRFALLDTYFPETKAAYDFKDDTIQGFLSNTNMLNEPIPTYSTRIRKISGFIRDWTFRGRIMEAYDDTCCISGLQIKPSYAIIEACHILPHAKTGNQSTKNGIALNIYLHRAFDAGMISLNDNYEVLVKPETVFTETNSSLNIRQFKDKRIVLPNDKELQPSKDYLKEHRDLHKFLG